MSTATDDLVSGLLAHLDALEREHHRAAEEMRQAARMKISNVLGDYVLASIADGLRLCRAHRDLIGEHQKRQQMADQLGFDEDSKDSDAHLSAQGIAAGLFAAVALVARGLGVEEQGSE